jgi:HEAT repeat protein
MAAVRCLASYASESDEIQSKLIQLTSDSFPLMPIAAVRVLQQVGDERAVPALKKLTKGDYDGRLKRLAEEAVEKITKGFE